MIKSTWIRSITSTSKGNASINLGFRWSSSQIAVSDTKSSSSNSTENGGKPQKSVVYHRCILYGFARNCSRIDLEMVLGENKPLNVDPFINRRDLLFAGHYRLQYRNAEEIGRLHSYLQKKYDKRFHLTNDSDLNMHQIPASILHVTRRTVLLRGLNQNVNHDTLFNWLTGYHLAPVSYLDFETGEKKLTNTIHLLQDREDENLKNAIIQCASIQEARRIVTNKALNDDLISLGQNLRIVHCHA